MLFKTAIEGFVLHMASGDYASRTVKLYEDILSHFAGFFPERQVESITLEDLQRFMVYLKTDYKPKRFGGSERPISQSYIDIHWKCIRAFYGWAAETLSIPRPDLKLSRPKYQAPEIEPFTEEEVKRILAACDHSRTIVKLNKKEYKIKCPAGQRNRLIIMILLDTGLRVGEFCRLQVQDVDLASGAVLVAPFETGAKTKPRTVYLGKSTRHQLWLYLANRGDYEKDDPLVPIREDAIRQFMADLEKRSGVHNVHPHRFRHTFAITFLRNRGDIFTLQRLLGHATLEMVRHYLQLADADSKDAHRRASPVDNWHL